jgi:hypothetical protein
VAVLCEVFKVSRSGFYAYRHRQAAAPIDREEVELVARVKAIAAQTGQSYGSRRMAKQLQAEGFQVGRCKARRLMQECIFHGCLPPSPWEGWLLATLCDVVEIGHPLIS